VEEMTVSLNASGDWLTVTTKHLQKTTALIRRVQELAVGVNLEKTSPRRWHFQGFHGWAVDGARWGLRGDEGIAMVSGSQAAALWQRLALYGERCTRVDLAVTVLLSTADKDVAARAYEQLVDASVVTGSLVVSSKGGSTCYVGSRSSMFFGRMYDRGVVEELPAGVLWRYELEVKKPASDAVLAQLLGQDDPGAWIKETVRQRWATVGLPVPWESGLSYSAIEITTDITTDERRLNWLTTQVRPAVSQLILHGYEDEVRAGLGLPASVNDLGSL